MQDTFLKRVRRRPQGSLLTIGAVAAVAFSALFVGSCAKVPETDLPATGRRLAVTLRVRGQIQPQSASVPYYYFAAINRTNATRGPGPYPKVNIPWANGVVASSEAGTIGYTTVVMYDGRQGLNGYQVYRVPVNSEGQVITNPDNFGPFPTGFDPLGEPVRSLRPQTGENTLYFEINLNDIPLQEVTGGQEGADYLHINLIATNNIPAGADPNSPKVWDAIGDATFGGSINQFLSFNAEQNFQRSNSDTASAEPANDVRDHDNGPVVDDANLDITDWTIELRDANTGS